MELRSELSWLEDFAAPPVLTPALALVPGPPAPAVCAGAPSFSSASWWEAAPLVWLTAKSANETPTIKQMTIEASRITRASGMTTQLD